MTYEKIVEKVRKSLSKIDATAVNGHLAVQVDIYGEGEGAFYIEVKDGRISVEPYEYFDHDLRIRCKGSEIIALVEGKKNILDEVSSENIEALRNVSRLDDLAGLFASPLTEKRTKVSVAAKTTGTRSTKKKTK